jgi:hypothetical protein
MVFNSIFFQAFSVVSILDRGGGFVPFEIFFKILQFSYSQQTYFLPSIIQQGHSAGTAEICCEERK